MKIWNLDHSRFKPKLRAVRKKAKAFESILCSLDATSSDFKFLSKKLNNFKY